MRENPLGGKAVMPIQRYKPEQIVTMLRQIEVGIANGKTLYHSLDNTIQVRCEGETENEMRNCRIDPDVRRLCISAKACGQDSQSPR
jgi:hypothetical protein